MSLRRALVVHTRMPAFDRDSGSQDVDNMVRFLLDAGWHVTFVAREERDQAEERHARRLRGMGVATHTGFGDVDGLLRSNDFDVAIIAFWELAATLLPRIRAISPATRVIVNSVDVHFLRQARQTLGAHQTLDTGFARTVTDELNLYAAADAVLAVSDKERDLLEDFLGEDRVFTLPLAESVERSPLALGERRGMYFVGNFRHLPNREAVEYLVHEVLPQLDPALLERHPLSVVGNWLDRVDLDLDLDTPGLRMVGWVPSIQPYLERSRLAAVPLLHGAGVKRKVIQAMMAGTPVVTTPVGAEGLHLVQGETALIGTDATDLAAGITRLLTDDALWQRMADAGVEQAQASHGMALVERTFADILDRVLSPRRRPFDPEAAAAAETAEVRHRIRSIGRPGEPVLVVCGDDPSLLDVGSHPCWPFPQAKDGAGVGPDPVDGPAALNHLDAQVARGARYLVLPRAAFSWPRRYPELFEALGTRYRRLHQDERLVVWDLAPGRDDAAPLGPVPEARVLVRGVYDARRTGPPPALVAELGAGTTLTVEQCWRPDSEPAAPVPDDVDFVVDVRDDVVLPAHFLDRLVATQVALDVDRLQPTHREGPAGGPPVTERHFGVVAREIDGVGPVPVRSMRAGAAPDGPTVLSDQLTIGLRRPSPTRGHAVGPVRRIWVLDREGHLVVHDRPEPAVAPAISVLISTYERPDLLRECLESFAAQTLASEQFEVVVVDDGSASGDLDALLAEFTDRMQVTGVRIGHAGRSAAKNVAVMLARAPIVLFFDDDDRAAPDYLERHLAAHAAKPAPGVAILGHTEWAPELELSPLMHYITDVDRLMFAYERLGDGQELDWRGFWEGRISCKRAFLLEHALHDQRLAYSIDIEMGWRLAPAGLRVVYDASARSFMARPIDFEAFCARTEAKGRAHALIAALHAGTEIAERLHVADAAKVWDEQGPEEHALRRRVHDLEARAELEPAALPKLHEAYRQVFRLLHTKGAATTAEETRQVTEPPTTVQPFPNTDPELDYDATPEAHRTEAPLLSITLPVWSRTPELAAMAQRTVERIWEVARIPTEVVVVDNGSPFRAEIAAKVYRYPENKGVATGWNTGIRLSHAPMVVVLNSDCRVEPGWDVALYEAASDGRRVAFPYTDHCDGQGFTSPDQGGTAGWCFMLSRALYDEVGVFDEWFNPAYCEDTDYWHRAWEMGVELSPVPAAHVVHARRTTAATDARGYDLLLQAHRFKYGWKHGVDPLRAPPYYNREVVDYVGSYRVPTRGPGPDPDRPRVFGIGLNKTGTTSLHEALGILGLRSLHWGGPALRRFVETSLAAGDPLLSRLDPHLDAFSDIQVLSEHFELLDRQYPGSRFVLTVRPLDDWIESRRRHVDENRRRRDAGTYHGTFLETDEPGWREHWERHVAAVREYFGDRADLLEIDLTARPGWGPLCAFLGVDEPGVPFPWANRRDED